jgi:hypothetical protein
MTVGRIAGGLLVALALTSAVQTAADEPINYINMFIRFGDEPGMGLAKLTRAERGRLNNVFRSIVEDLNDNLRNSALAYLKNSGWRELEVTGTEEMELDTIQGRARYVTARGSGTKYVLEPKSLSTLMPGDYLGRTDSTECRLLSPQGSAVEFWIRSSGPDGIK